MDRFELEGVTYYQQRRKCGKATCQVCQVGQGHGPYWYSRNQGSGRVAYIGRELPHEVAEARRYHDTLLGAMVAERRRLLALVDALSRLIGNKPLKPGDREALAGLGYGAALVSEPALSVAQDGEQ